MQPTLFGLFVALIGIWCQFRGFRSTIVAMFGLIVFGAVAALDLPALGGASVTPANMFLLFYALRLVSMRDGAASLVAEIGPRRPLFVFLLLVIWIFGSAFLLPRLFDGATDVFSLSRALDNDGDKTPLHPTGGNLSQAVYAVGGFMVACVTCAFARRPEGMKAILTGVVVVTSLHLTFAFLDLFTAATHTGFLLDLIHTASYAFLTNDELGGLKRLSGSFSEASTFATFSLTLLGVNFPLFVMRIKPRFTGIASLLLTCAIVLSTSSAGYAGLAVFFCGFFLYAAVAGLIWRRRRVTTLAFVTVCTGILLVSLVILFLPSVADVAQNVVGESLLNKATTDSAIERGSWNAQAWQVFRDTYGLGAGIGSTRGSNYMLVLLSNLGAIGFGLFVLLMLRVTLSPLPATSTADDRAVFYAARIGILTTLVPTLLIGTVYDLGTLFYCLIGVAASGVGARRAPAPASAPIPVRGRRTPAFSNASFRSGA